MSNRVLCDLHQNLIARLEGQFDSPWLVSSFSSLPVDLTGIKNCIATATNVDKRSLHGGQHVLNLAQVDVSNDRGALSLCDVVLYQLTVLENTNLNALINFSHDHLAVY